MGVAYSRHMAEWQPRHDVVGNFDNRSDYHFSDGAAHKTLKKNAFEAIESVMAIQNPTGHAGMWQYFKGGVAVRNLIVSYFDSENDSRSNTGLRPFISTELHSETKLGAFGDEQLTETLQMTVNEKNEGYRHQFVYKYLLERYAGESIQATVSGTHPVDVSGRFEREMLPYDFIELRKQLEVLKSIREGVVSGKEKEGETA